MYKLHMRTFTLFVFSVFLLGMSLISCTKERYCINTPAFILGEWTWVETYGGFGGWTYTPATEGYTRKLVFDKTNCKTFINDQLTDVVKYLVEVKTDSTYSSEEKIYMTFENGEKYFVNVSCDELTLRELCFDCFDHVYKR